MHLHYHIISTYLSLIVRSVVKRKAKIIDVLCSARRHGTFLYGIGAHTSFSVKVAVRTGNLQTSPQFNRQMHKSHEALKQEMARWYAHGICWQEYCGNLIMEYRHIDNLATKWLGSNNHNLHSTIYISIYNTQLILDGKQHMIILQSTKYVTTIKHLS